jgi:hypothetical protein
MSRKSLFLFAVPIAILSWMGMQAVHELGHVLGAWLSGGVVQGVVLAPLTISRTDVSPNPHPLFVAWAGPIVGVILPLAVAVFVRRAGRVPRGMAQFFAGFCLIANGLYIGVGSFDAVGDAGDMLRHGSPQWLLILFGGTCSILGLWMWHCLTKRPLPSLAAENAV